MLHMQTSETCLINKQNRHELLVIKHNKINGLVDLCRISRTKAVKKILLFFFFAKKRKVKRYFTLYNSPNRRLQETTINPLSKTLAVKLFFFLISNWGIGGWKLSKLGAGRLSIFQVKSDSYVDSDGVYVLV